MSIPKKWTLKEAKFTSDWATPFKSGSLACGSTLMHSLFRGLKPTTLSVPGLISPLLDTISFHELV